ncbi:MAG: VTT domain-containing protein [Bdellovibrionota bacterium]
MEYDFAHWLTSDNGFGVHITVLSMLLLGGLGFPMPEDIPLVLGGVAASQGIVSIKGMFLTCYVGVLLADQIIFLFGFFFGQRLLNAGTRSTFFPSITESRVQRVRDGLRRRRLVYILLGRHFFPLRTATFLIAGTLRIPFIEFLIADAFAALLSVGLVLWVGYFLGGKLTPEMISHIVHQAHYYLAGFVALLALMYLINRTLRKRKVADEAPAEIHDSL